MSHIDGRGCLNALNIINNWYYSILPAEIQAELTAIAQNPPQSWPRWTPAKAAPQLYSIADDPTELIQPKSPAMVLTFTGQNVNSPRVMYDYAFRLSYYTTAAAAPDVSGDNSLLDCCAIQGGVYRAVKKVPAGAVNLVYNGCQISAIMAAADQTLPQLARLLTFDLTLQIEEDY